MISAYAVFCPTAKLSVTKHSLQTKPENPDAADKSQIVCKNEKNSVELIRGQCQRLVEKESKAFRSTEQMGSA